MVSGLTNRELEVLTLAAEGLANKQIAQRLWVTPKTIKFHLSNVFRKLDVSNRTEATRQAQRLGLLQVGGGADWDRAGPAGRAGPAAPRRPFLLAAPAGAVRGEIPCRGASHPPRMARMAAGARGGGVVAVGWCTASRRRPPCAGGRRLVRSGLVS